MKKRIVRKLKEKYNVHPLLFHRSLEKAKTEGELFDILDTIPNSYPLKWDKNLKRWVKTDLFKVIDLGN